MAFYSLADSSEEAESGAIWGVEEIPELEERISDVERRRIRRYQESKSGFSRLRRTFSGSWLVGLSEVDNQDFRMSQNDDLGIGLRIQKLHQGFLRSKEYRRLGGDPQTCDKKLPYTFLLLRPSPGWTRENSSGDVIRNPRAACLLGSQSTSPHNAQGTELTPLEVDALE